MWQTPEKHVFRIFLGLSLKIFRIKFKFLIEFFKSFHMQFLDLETSCYHEIYRKNWKNLTPLKLIYLEKYGIVLWQLIFNANAFHNYISLYHVENHKKSSLLIIRYFFLILHCIDEKSKWMINPTEDYFHQTILAKTSVCWW